MSVAISKNKPAAVLPAVAVFGCGNMGGAIIRGLCRTGYADSTNIVGCDTDPDQLKALAEETGIRLTSDPVEAGRGADVLIIAVKPKLVETVIKQLAAGYSKKDRPVIVSIAAGVTIKRIARAWGTEEKIVRVMPNLACTVQAGVFGIYSTAPSAAEFVSGLLSPLGETVTLGSEREIDAVTAISASGPAFFAQAVDGMILGGVKMGLTSDNASRLAVQTMLGTAKLLAVSGDHPAVLQAKVSSPAGTTIYGLHELEAAGVRGAFISAIEAAAMRAIEISEEEE